MPMIATTIISSIKVKPEFEARMDSSYRIPDDAHGRLPANAMP
jgi:hypothetical protein